MPEFPIPSARILLVSQIQGGEATSPPSCPVRLWLDRSILVVTRPVWTSISRASASRDGFMLSYLEIVPRHRDLRPNDIFFVPRCGLRRCATQLVMVTRLSILCLFRFGSDFY